MSGLDPADDTTSEENKTVVVGHTPPRCLRRADSGVPHEEELTTPRSDTSASPPLDAANATSVVNGVGGLVGYVSCGGRASASHSHASTNSETSSSGVHSNASNTSSNVSQATSGSSGVQQRRATSVDDLSGGGGGLIAAEPREEPQWRSCSLQRGIQPPTSSFSSPTSRPGTSQSFSPQYVNHTPQPLPPPPPPSSSSSSSSSPLLNGTEKPLIGGCPAVILENPNEATVVIRRRLSRPKIADPLNPNEEPFSRSTNMRMTSFTEGTAAAVELRGIQASSATLPHYPTQPIVTYPHCSTMPLPHASHSMAGNKNIQAGPTTGGSCGSVTRHVLNFVQPQQQQLQQPPQQLQSHPTGLPAHTTLPSHHHNGTRLVHGAAAAAAAAAAANPFVKRFPPMQMNSQPWALPGHHTFPQQLQNKLAAPAMQVRQNDRDSANFSMASSGDSDTCLPH